MASPSPLPRPRPRSWRALERKASLSESADNLSIGSSSEILDRIDRRAAGRRPLGLPAGAFRGLDPSCTPPRGPRRGPRPGRPRSIRRDRAGVRPQGVGDGHPAIDNGPPPPMRQERARRAGLARLQGCRLAFFFKAMPKSPAMELGPLPPGPESGTPRRRPSSPAM